VHPFNQVSCCKYQQWFAVEGGSEVDPLRCLDRGRWSDCPDYVCHTAPLSRESVRALASFRLGAHDLDVESGKFQSRSTVGNAQALAVLLGCVAFFNMVLVMRCICLLSVKLMML
jgi:hypothetical protein